MLERTGEVKTVDETTYIEWRMSDIFVKENFLYESPIFFSADRLWSLFLGQSSDGTISIAIRTKGMEREHSLRYTFGLKKHDGNVEKKVSGVLESDKNCCLWSHFIKKEELLQRKEELAASNVLTITCTLKRMMEVSYSDESAVFSKPKPMLLTKLLSRLENSLKSIPLLMAEKAGNIEIAYETKHIEWKISNIFDKDHFLYDSPHFTTAADSWNVLLRQSSDGCIAIAISTRVKRKYPLRYCFGLKKRNGNAENIISGILEGDKCCSLWSSFIKKEELLRRKTELAPFNILTVTCTLKRVIEIFPSTELTVLDKTKSLNFTSKL